MKRVLTLFIIVACYKYVSCYMRVCYYTNWSQYRPNGGMFTPEKIDPNLCSHIIYAFGKLEGNLLVPFEWNDDSTDFSTGMYEKVNNLKVTNPTLKTLLAMGGWNAGSLPFSDMVATKASRKQFINSTLHYLRQRNFDGLDMDWEYPAKRGGRPEDKANLVLLLAELMQAFEQESYHTGRPRLLLSAAVPAGKSNIDAGYDIPNVARNLDFINIMSYDLHGSWEPVTGHNSPLFGRTGETPEDAMLNMEWAVNYWSKKGAPKHKLVVGLGLYGRSFNLKSVTKNGLGAAATGAGKAGKYTREPGFLSYYEVCEELKTGATRVWQAEHRAPYLYKGNLWVGYDDEESVRAKVRWVKQKGYGGIMIWSLALDDFSGTFCNKGPYPLLTAINAELGHTVAKTQSPSRSVQKRSHALATTPSTHFSANNHISGHDLVGALAHIMTPPLTPDVSKAVPNILPETTQPAQVSHAITPPKSPMMESNFGNLAAAAAIGELLLQGKANLNPPGTKKTATKTAKHANTGNKSQQSLPIDLNINNAAPASIIPAIPLEFVHGSHGNSKGAHHSAGNAGDVSIVATNSNAPGHGTVSSNSLSHGLADLHHSPSHSNHHSNNAIGHIDIKPLHPSVPPEPNPAFTIHSAHDTGSHTVGASSNVANEPIVIGTLPVVPGARSVSEMVPSPNNFHVSSGSLTPGGTAVGIDTPIAQATHSDIGLRNVRPAPPAQPTVNFSISSSSSSNSSSSSSSSSSTSKSRNIKVETSSHVSPGHSSGSHGHASVRPSLHELLQRGSVDIHPVAVNNHDVSSVVDHNQGIVPGGTVEAVIPIENIDSLAQVLASLETSIPTAGSVLVPEPRNEISPRTVLRELDIGNILGSNVATPTQVTLAPPRRREPMRSRTVSPRLTETRQIDPRRSTLDRQVLERLRQEQLRRRSLQPTASLPRPSTPTRRQSTGNPVTIAQLRGLVSILGRTTVRELLQTGRIRLSPTVQRRQVIRRPVTRTRVPNLRSELLRRQQLSPIRRLPSISSPFPSSLRPISSDRNISFLGSERRLPTARRSVDRRRPQSRDTFSSFGFV